MNANMIEIPLEGGRIPLDAYDLEIKSGFLWIQPKIDIEPELDPEDAELERQEAVYKALHPSLKETHLGQFVAIHDGRVVDSDTDRTALRERLMDAYPDRFMPIRPVEETLPQPIRMPMSFYRLEPLDA